MHIQEQEECMSCVASPSGALGDPFPFQWMQCKSPSFKTWWPFLSMQTWASYLLQNCPGMLLSGYTLSNPMWKQAMRLFWGAYQSIDPAHFIYASDYSWDTMILYCFHGDDGRGSGRVPFLVLSWQPIVSHKGMDQCNDSSQL